MLLSKGSVKLRSLGLSPFVLALTAGLAGSATTGCFFFEDDHHHDDYDYDTDYDEPVDVNGDGVINSADDIDGDGDIDWDDWDAYVPEPPSVPTYSIQADQVFETKPGEGVGIFVEYQSGGKWRVFTTCDTFVSKEVCAFDILASTRRADELLAYATDGLEGFDEVRDLGEGMVELIADTDSDTDGVVLELEPGSPLQIEVYLDGQSAQKFVYWVSDDTVHAGVPENPVQFAPLTK